MPVYEEKLICPFAVRFTQEHIRPMFQDKTDLEATIKQITARPGTGNYDIILEAPFPTIEIVRWLQADASNLEPDTQHWFTLDNRRLYCLQRVAAALWPQRAATVVEVLYNATDGIRRKDDSLTAGRSVGIGHSPKTLLSRWDWRHAVVRNPSSPEEATPSKPSERAVHDLVSQDDKRSSVQELLDAPAPPSMLERFLQGSNLAVGQAALEKAGDCPSENSSTTYPTSPRSSDSDHLEAAKAEIIQKRSLPSSFESSLCGRWLGPKGETYEIRVDGKASWICCRLDASKKSFALWFDEGSDAVWWGTHWSLCLDAAEVRKHPQQVTWYNSTDNGKWKPRFTWYKAGVSAEVHKKGNQKASRGKK